MPEWNLFFTLPNLDAPVPTPYESDGCVICCGSDERLDRLAENAGNRTARRMLERFSTTRGERYRPSCLLVERNAVDAIRHPETLRAFRNVCSIATTTRAYIASLENPDHAQWAVSWSDQFLFGYFTPGLSGWVQTLDGPVRGIDDEIPRMQAAAQFGNPTHFRLMFDAPLLERLLLCWRRYHLRRSQRRAFIDPFDGEIRSTAAFNERIGTLICGLPSRRIQRSSPA